MFDSKRTNYNSQVALFIWEGRLKKAENKFSRCLLCVQWTNNSHHSRAFPKTISVLTFTRRNLSCLRPFLFAHKWRKQNHRLCFAFTGSLLWPCVYKIFCRWWETCAFKSNGSFWNWIQLTLNNLKNLQIKIIPYNNVSS